MASSDKYTSRVSIPGLQKLSSQSRVRRITWTTLLLSGLGFTLFLLYHRVAYYLTYPSDITVRQEILDTVPYPAVSICNWNLIRQRDVSRLSDLDRRLVEWQSGLARNFTDSELQSVNWTTFLKTSGHQIDTMLLGCYWKSDTCGPADFTSVVTDYGVCYTFNFGDRNLHSHLGGQTYGLELILDAEVDMYLNQTMGVGFRLAIHHPMEIPLFNIDTPFLNIAIGKTTNIALRSEVRRQLKSPYGNCGKKQLRYYTQYSESRCRLECMANYSKDLCHCKAPFMPGDGQICDPNKWNQNCSAPFTKHLAGALLRCKCPQNCTEFSYEKIISVSDNGPALNFEIGRDRDQRNIAHVYVFYEQLTQTVIEQVVTFTWFALMSDIGGSLGLSLGMCLITFVEVVDLLLIKLSHSWEKSVGKRPRGRSQMNAQLDTEAVASEIPIMGRVAHGGSANGPLSQQPTMTTLCERCETNFSIERELLPAPPPRRTLTQKPPRKRKFLQRTSLNSSISF